MGTIAVEIARRIAREDGVDELALEPPLYESIDVDALEQLLESGFSGTVSFEYRDYVVTVDGAGDVSVTPSGVEGRRPSAGSDRPKAADRTGRLDLADVRPSHP